MKRQIPRIVALYAIAAGLALVSCAKQDAMDNGKDSPASGARVIAVSFANSSTKSTLDGFQPYFAAGDVIKVSNGTKAEDCVVEVDGDKATISTTLTGALTMVYPSTAAKMNGNAIEGIQVPTVQDGTFASANICKAEIAAGATSATFANQTAVFKITPAAGATYVEVIAPHGKELADYVPEGSTYDCDSYHKIHVPVTSGEAVYVSVRVPESLSLNALTFASNCGIKTPASTDALAVNSLYTVTAENWNHHPYVEIGGKKWATMNVGATTVAGCHCTCYGDYFAWGETAPYYSAISRTSASTATFTWKDGKGSGYKWQSYCGSSSFSEWSTPPYDATSKNLTSSYDAVTANWGSGWRMPKSDEFVALRNACTGDTGSDQSTPTTLPATIEAGGVYWVSSTQTSLPEYTGVAGLLFVDKSDTSKRVFFPAAGYVDGSSFNNGGSYGRYWSSSLYTYTDYARYLYFTSGLVEPSYNIRRYRGFTLRPVSE